MPTDPGDRERRFLAEYLIDGNAVQSYLRAFPGTSYRSAATLSGRLLKKVEVQAELRAARDAHASRCEADAGRVLRELAAVAFADVADLFAADGRLLPVADIPPATRRAIAKLTIRRAGEVDQLVTITLCPKLDALEKLCRLLGLYDRTANDDTRQFDAVGVLTHLSALMAARTPASTPVLTPEVVS